MSSYNKNIDKIANQWVVLVKLSFLSWGQLHSVMSGNEIKKILLCASGRATVC